MAKLIRIETATSIYNIPKGVSKVAFDGCHKFYIIEDENDLKEMIENGYEKDKMVDIDSLADVFLNTGCGLRFINTAKLESVVPQFEDAKFAFDDGTYLESDFYSEDEEEEEYDEDDEYKDEQEDAYADGGEDLVDDIDDEEDIDS